MMLKPVAIFAHFTFAAKGWFMQEWSHIIIITQHMLISDKYTVLLKDGFLTS